MNIFRLFSTAVLAIGLACASFSSLAQQPQGPIRSQAVSATPGAAAGTPEAAQSAISQAPAAASAPEVSDQELGRLKSDFDLLKILGILAIVAAAAIGLGWYAIRHKRLQSFDTTGGIVLSFLLAPLFLMGATMALSTDASACLGLALGSGADASAFTDACRTAREATANLVGFRSIWSLVFGQNILNGVVVAYPASVIRALMYASVCIAAPLLFLIVKPALKAGLYKR